MRKPKKYPAIYQSSCHQVPQKTSANLFQTMALSTDDNPICSNLKKKSAVDGHTTCCALEWIHFNQLIP
jgi:hypothetical protein